MMRWYHTQVTRRKIHTFVSRLLSTAICKEAPGTTKSGAPARLCPGLVADRFFVKTSLMAFESVLAHEKICGLGRTMPSKPDWNYGTTESIRCGSGGRHVTYILLGFPGAASARYPHCRNHDTWMDGPISL